MIPKVMYLILTERRKPNFLKMATLMPAEMPGPGFSFENCKRNAFLASNNYKAPKVNGLAVITRKRETVLGWKYNFPVL